MGLKGRWSVVGLPDGEGSGGLTADRFLKKIHKKKTAIGGLFFTSKYEEGY